jgi:hypothetical protein
MSATIIKTEFRTDVAGTYLAHVFSDGHTETDPPNRPLSKEDLQRQIRDAAALDKSKAMLANEHTRYTRSPAQKAAPNAQQIARDEFNTIAGGSLIKSFNDAINASVQFAVTASAPAGQVEGLIATVPLGGELPPGDGAVEFITEVARAAPPASAGNAFTYGRAPVELRRGLNNG